MRQSPEEVLVEKSFSTASVVNPERIQYSRFSARDLDGVLFIW
jgi:hypothetical protein